MEDQAPTTHSSNIQLSGQGPDSAFLLSVLAKRTYTIGKDGYCRPAETQIPLITDHQYSDTFPDLLKWDFDLYPYKLYTDVIVKGVARSPRPVARFNAEVNIGRHTASAQIIGPRKAYRLAGGTLAFSDPEPIDEVELTYTNAYGGGDPEAEAAFVERLEKELKEALPNTGLANSASPFFYPRNPVGKGFLLEATPDKLEQLELPSIEDPKDLLTPDRLEVKTVGNWVNLPLPRCFDFVDVTWFPRVAYMGGMPYLAKENNRFPEWGRGWGEPHFDPNDMESVQSGHFRMANGASLGLQLPYLKGNEKVRLVNIHPEFSDFSFRLPNEVPMLKVDGRNGKLKKTTPVIHTVVIEPELSRLTVLWRGSSRALRPYMEKELEEMPFEVKW